MPERKSSAVHRTPPVTLITVKNLPSDDNSKETPEVTTILCKSQDSACKDKIVLGLQTKDGGTTTGSIVLLPF